MTAMGFLCEDRLVRFDPVRKINRQFEGEQSASEKLALEEEQLAKSHLRPLEAPVGVTPVLKCWMEIH